MRTTGDDPTAGPIPRTWPPTGWDNPEQLAVILRSTYPDVDPREESFDALREYIVALPSFAGTPDGGDLGVLEVVRSLWWWGLASPQDMAW